jgi:hypothetical protein
MDALQHIVSLCNLAEYTADQIDLLERQLSEAKQRHRELLERQIPDAMDAAGIDTLKLSNGKTVTVQPFLDCSIRADDREAAYRWLVENGHGGIVKREVTAQFRAGDPDAVALADELRRRAMAVDLKESVHAQTLKKFAREFIATGGTLPEMFSVYSGARATIK